MRTATPHKSEVASMKDRIHRAKTRAKTRADLARVERAMHRLWGLGLFTVSQFQRLDALLCDARDNLTD
jgi:hypothetical protein